jgi:hypothetical protein
MHSEPLEFRATIFSQVKFYFFAYGCIVYYIYMFVYRHIYIITSISLIFFTFIEVLLLLSTIYKSNYCTLANNILTIKNHVAFWKNKRYDLKKIYSIDYISIPRAGSGLKIKLRNAPASTHCLNGLSNKSFIELYHIFKQHNIKLSGFTGLDKELT